MGFNDGMEAGVRGFEVAGVAVLALGSQWALARAGARTWWAGRSGIFAQARQDLGRSILLGLEILIIADIVQTITIDPALESERPWG